MDDGVSDENPVAGGATPAEPPVPPPAVGPSPAPPASPPLAPLSPPAPAPPQPAAAWQPGPPDHWAPPVGPAVIEAPRRKRWPKVLQWGGIALMIIGFVGLAGDWIARNWEMTQLLTAIEASEGAMTRAQDGMAAVDLPADPSPAEIAGAQEELKTVSQVGSREVASAGLDVGQVSFLPWHTELLSAQGSYLAHNRAWVEYLSAGAQDPATLFTDDNDIAPTWAAAERGVRAAVPYVPWPGIEDRVELIFLDTSTDDGGDSGLTT